MAQARPTDPAIQLGRGYPRPQFQREQWTNLNGTWDFALDPEARWNTPQQVQFNATIRVPFAPETPASGVGRTDYFRACWYRRIFPRPRVAEDGRVILHFGAVDYHARVWVNGQLAAEHEGGYTPFSADITPFLCEGRQTLVVRAEDDPLDLAKPRGKQDWHRDPHSIFYFRTTGIWQTVWLESVGRRHLRHLRWTTDVGHGRLGLEAAANDGGELRLRVTLRHKQRTLVDDLCGMEQGRLCRQFALSDDWFAKELLWRPGHPSLIEARLELLDADGVLLDRVESYTALRSVSVDAGGLRINNQPVYLRMALDQGYWPDGGLTAPDDAALRRDVELALAMGFNAVRKHQKIEDPRYLYWADHLGLMVWEEMPSAYEFSPRATRRLARQWMEVIERDMGHPCIIAWVPYNESWGVPDMKSSPAQRDAVAALYHLARTLDGTRPVIGNDGWEASYGEMIGIHDYSRDPETMVRRYEQLAQDPERLLHLDGPAGRVLLLEGYSWDQRPLLLTEFGGIAYAPGQRGAWGYSRAASPADLARRYAALLETVRRLPLIHGFCYTQFTDTYQEANGLLTMDRRPKFALEKMRRANGK